MRKEEEPLRVALLGTGIFAKNCHIPTLQKFPEIFDCVAVWSRRKESVETLLQSNAFLASSSNNNAAPQGYNGEDGLQQILQERKDIQVVIMALPLDVQPQYVTMALEAGKHVLSEKPIAPTVEEAQRLCDFYYSSKNFPVNLQWSVAENFRYEPGIQRVADAVKTDIGTPLLFSLNIRLPFKSNNPYLQTTWRRQPSWYGGLFPDVFVHSTAMVRKVLDSGAPTKVSAMTSSHAHHIPSVDTMVANAVFQNNTDVVQGSISLSFAASSTFVKLELEVTGTEGYVVLQRKTSNEDGPPGYYVTVNGQTKEEFGYAGIEHEFEAFGKACRQKDEETTTSNDIPVDWNSPLEALKDLAFVEACLESGKNGGQVVVLDTNYSS